MGWACRSRKCGAGQGGTRIARPGDGGPGGLQRLVFSCNALFKRHASPPRVAAQGQRRVVSCIVHPARRLVGSRYPRYCVLRSAIPVTAHQSRGPGSESCILSE
ncbi:hypothetical protein VFPFJ_09056 [Purpureocillium lilacinum]|uniref:Uncharacterized protein n=1 Tax=Purpureocillium lilacinum TaxID=33203 RepID=A0A179H149_PURLI|nr:hypothetical protein VFPFJ_09056 [Purpureocillium lilacinum]OAQ83253.1 hypothetical protein VFPFJ_09056 [Purpureocillium lilacinum]